MSISMSAIASGGAAAVDPSKVASRIASKMIKDFDTNKDGSLDKQEFVAGLTAKGISADEAGKQFDAIDTKKTGSITKADIETAIKSGVITPPPTGARPVGGAGHAGGRGAAGGADTTLSYDPADTNQDGTVSPQEALVYGLSHQAKASAVTTDPAKLGNNVDKKV